MTAVSLAEPQGSFHVESSSDPDCDRERVLHSPAAQSAESQSAEPPSSGPDSSTNIRWVEVLVDCPGAQGAFTYEIPQTTEGELLQVAPGDILLVPFGAQQLGAIALRGLTELQADVEPHNLRPILEVVAQGFFPHDYWPLLEKVAHYYATPMMGVVRTALPPKLLGKSQRRVRLRQSVTDPRTELDPDSLGPTAQAILQQLQQAKQGSYTWRYLKQQVRGAETALRELRRLGWVESFLETPATCQPKRQKFVTLVQTTAVTQPLTEKQAGVLQQLRQQGGELPLAQLLALAGTSDSIVKSLARKGCVTLHWREVLRQETGPAVQRDAPKRLTCDQSLVLQSLQQLTGFTSVLLHGVTGSGKTEVYLQAIAPYLQAGQSALVLVPEIGLTPQLTDRFRQRFGDRVCVYHSGLSVGERYDTWRQMLQGHPQVVIGTRSAVFAPLPHIGLIILDEQHDSSFKQEQPMPCYDARTVARWRAEMQHCPLILGSATPAAEAWQQHQSPDESPARFSGDGSGSFSGDGSGDITTPAASAQRSHLYLSLPQRIHARPHPPVEVVDLREELLQGNRSVFSRKLQQAITETVDRGQQGLLFIHRRGHSTFVSCRSCGEAIYCPHCDVSLTYHHTHAEAQPILRCHYCNYVQAHPKVCPSCQSPYLKNFGSGTQRVTQALKQQFPNLRVLRFDSDTTRTKGAHRRLLEQFAAGRADLLVGTQMLTKGIDLPQVTLVGIVAADGLLHQSDFRAAERACQTLLQVAGRAGRGDEAGRVILQTYTPEHPVIQAVRQQTYPNFLAQELQQRQALGYPPYNRLISLRLSGLKEAAVMASADRLAQHLEGHYRVLGPAPATIGRVAQRYRWHLLIQLDTHPDTHPDSHPNLAAQKQPPQLSLDSLRPLCSKDVHLTIDVDPLYLG